ncbi:MAG TPA: YncE family protein [Gemmatimonadaceae bacterium]|nr:YncE family protein [Gemmatimonadaceae bacterium]
MQRAITALAFSVAICAGVACATAQSPRQQRLLILSKNDQLMSIVDPSSLKILAQVPTGPDPHEMVASDDGTRAYISNYGGGAYNTLTVVDLVNRRSLGTIDLGALRGPHGLHYSGGKVWFTAEAAKAIGSYDPATNKIDLVLGSGQDGTHMIYAFADQSRLVATNVGSGTVTFFEKRAGPRPNWSATTLPAGPRSEGFDVTPDEKAVWTANAGNGTITMIDVATKTVANFSAGVQGANRLKFTPDGSLALVSTLGAPDLRIIRVSDHSELKRIPVGTGAAGIQIQPDGTRAYVACSPDNYVAVIDLKSMAVVGKIEAGRNPDGLAWAAIPSQ